MKEQEFSRYNKVEITLTTFNIDTDINTTIEFDFCYIMYYDSFLLIRINVSEKEITKIIPLDKILEIKTQK